MQRATGAQAEARRRRGCTRRGALALLAGLAIAFAACPAPPTEGGDPNDLGQLEDQDSDVMGSTGLDVEATVAAPETTAGPTCGADGDCKAPNACTLATCVSGSCDFAPRTCAPDDNPCTDAVCRPDAGCVQLPNLEPCDDGLGCTSEDRCVGGVCQGRALDCDDAEACTVDACEEGVGCRHDPTPGACDDDDACTTGDRCLDGACVGEARICPVPPGSAGCSIATCDPRTGCGLREGTGACDDGDACTSGDACLGGACVGALVRCNDDDPCSDDSCDPALGCRSVPNRAPCDDGDACTEGDRCLEGSCQPGAVSACCDVASDCDDGDPCTSDACEDHVCVRTATCDDGNACTLDGCSAGVCSAAPFPPVPVEADGGLLIEGFEAATDGRWSFESDNPAVGWQRDEAWSFEGGWSLYVGKVPDYSYDFGATRALATWRGPLPVDAERLVVRVRAAVAETSCSYDVVTVALDGVPLGVAVCGSNGDGADVGWDIAGRGGREVELSFAFDTVDDQDNAGNGVWLDALRVARVGAAQCCETAADCPSDPLRACRAARCDTHRCGFDDSACD